MSEINLNIKEVNRHQLSAQIAVQSAILDIEKRVPFRKVMKQLISRVERGGTLASVQIGSRLNGAEIARTENWSQSALYRLCAPILNYARGVAHTSFYAIGIKV